MNKDEVQKLAKLARIELGDTEAEGLALEMGKILEYVSEVKSVSGEANNQQLTTNNFPIRNVMREDGEPHESGIYSEKLLAEAPNSEDGYIKVPKIL